jgi:hypothetical protein
MAKDFDPDKRFALEMDSESAFKEILEGAGASDDDSETESGDEETKSTVKFQRSP